MKFSIIVPVYNAEKYIRQSIQSVLNQTYQDYEIVLVDDGSLDGSGKICDELARLYPDKVQVLHQKNQGQLLTRGNGIEASRGEYCLFLDADDALRPEGLQLLENTIGKYQKPDMIIYSFFYDREEGKKERAVPLFTENRIFEGEEEKRELYEKFFSTTLLNNVWTKAVKRSVFEGEYPDYQKYSHLRCSEDRLHSMGMISNADTVVYMNEAIYEYKIITKTFTIDAIDRFNVKVLYEEEKKYLEKWDLQPEIWLEKMNASWILQTWYVLDKFYNNAVGPRQKKLVLEYNWKQFVPEEILSNYKDNPYLTEQQKLCWKWVEEEEHKFLKRYFWKKAFISKLRKLKRNISGRK